ncbi:hypothetical protein BESB_014800 [Besnoitia besnoiti]|uniref:Transmembrane protein n=1 Tax=Besnoitia besnoiti TaxID=94643 RepID=A0A2A9MB69_BESBE|nr:hypothetical protein BESB_014800 [Besnoitia besnoiti]PFH32867.1 hypothetical protein BESB_014800 [Besnoitia besnoiti]
MQLRSAFFAFLPTALALAVAPRGHAAAELPAPRERTATAASLLSQTDYALPAQASGDVRGAPPARAAFQLDSLAVGDVPRPGVGGRPPRGRRSSLRAAAATQRTRSRRHPAARTTAVYAPHARARNRRKQQQVDSTETRSSTDRHYRNESNRRARTRRVRPLRSDGHHELMSLVNVVAVLSFAAMLVITRLLRKVGNKAIENAGTAIKPRDWFTAERLAQRKAASVEPTQKARLRAVYAPERCSDATAGVACRTHPVTRACVSSDSKEGDHTVSFRLSRAAEDHPSVTRGACEELKQPGEKGAGQPVASAGDFSPCRSRGPF